MERMRRPFGQEAWRELGRQIAPRLWPYLLRSNMVDCWVLSAMGDLDLKETEGTLFLVLGRIMDEREEEEWTGLTAAAAAQASLKRKHTVLALDFPSHRAVRGTVEEAASSTDPRVMVGLNIIRGQQGHWSRVCRRRVKNGAQDSAR